MNELRDNIPENVYNKLIGLHGRDRYSNLESLKTLITKEQILIKEASLLEPAIYPYTEPVSIQTSLQEPVLAEPTRVQENIESVSLQEPRTVVPQAPTQLLAEEEPAVSTAPVEDEVTNGEIRPGGNGSFGPPIPAATEDEAEIVPEKRNYKKWILLALALLAILYFTNRKKKGK